MEHMEAGAPTVVKLVSVDPDRLIEIGQRLKQTAMDNCYPGESVVIPFTGSISFVYKPEKEFIKPLHTTRVALEASE